MVARSLEPGIRIQDLARRNGICASLIYRWRREQPVSAAAARLVPVRIAAESLPCIEPVPPPRAEPHMGAARDRSRSSLRAVCVSALVRT